MGARSNGMTVWVYNAPELFAVAPPIESLQCLQRMSAQDSSTSVMHVCVCVMRAYFYTAVYRGICVI